MPLKLATFVIALGYSLIIPVMPFYMKNLGAGGKELGWLTAIYALTQTLCAPFWGVLSDRIGRKPIISIGMLGYTISLLLFGLASFWTLLIARALSGILSSATSVASLAYVGDSSTEDERSKNMGQLGAAMSIGVMLGRCLAVFWLAIHLHFHSLQEPGFHLLHFTHCNSSARVHRAVRLSAQKDSFDF